MEYFSGPLELIFLGQRGEYKISVATSLGLLTVSEIEEKKIEDF